jgi:hypothetical protein
MVAAACAGLAPVPAAAGPDRPAFSLTVSPTRLVVAGDALRDTQVIEVVNGGTRALDIHVSKRDFVGGPDGSLAFRDSAPYSASNWITVSPTRFRLAPDARRKVRVRVSVPARPEVGDHQVAIVFLVPAGPGGGNIKINRGIGAPVYVTVPGPVDDSVRLTRLSAPGFAFGGPIRISATAQSTGTVHRDFRDDARLRVHVAGRTVPFPEFTVVRGATRDVTAVWRHPPLFCLCDATVVVPDAGGSPQTVAFRVVIVPVPLIGLVLGCALLGFTVLYLARRRYRAQVLAAARALRSDDG